MTEFAELVRQVCQQLEPELRLPADFLTELLKEPDWSFVIKTHALVEAAVSQLLSAAAMNPALEHVFRRLETSNPRTGKLAFVKAMGLLSEHRRTFIQQLSELRNTLVHDVAQSRFTFEPYLRSLDKNQQRKFGQAFSWKTAPYDGAPKDDWIENAIAKPQLAIWINLLLLLIEASKKRAEFESFMDEHDVP